MKNEFRSVYHELLLNKLCPIDEQYFSQLLIKAANVYQSVAKTKSDLTCKYFNEEYNIIRNDQIGIGHVLALIIYTDVTDFCTAFRATYRKLGDEEQQEDITSRHQQLYNYSRFLFEAVEFYGTRMPRNLRVYHGLSKQLKFPHFTAFFNQPISTTNNFVVAQQFSKCTGIILALRSTKRAIDENKIPKFLGIYCLLIIFPHQTHPKQPIGINRYPLAFKLPKRG